jgi:hypothetical protein
MALLFMSLSFFLSCGEEAGLYSQEKLVFEEQDELLLNEQNSSEYGSLYGFYGLPYAPWPIFDYYNEPLPVYVPINPFTNLIEWIHPMYVGLYLSGNFGPRD